MRATNNRRTESTGFTLIELMVVITIILVLAGILFPVFSSARQSGRRTMCLSNLYQLGQAISMYRVDYDGYYPYALDPDTRDAIPLQAEFNQPYLSLAQTMPLLNDVLSPYVQAPAIFRCPSERNSEYNAKALAVYQKYGLSYRYNPYPAMLQCAENCFDDPVSSFLMSDTQPHIGEDYTNWRLNELFADTHVKDVSWADYLASDKSP